jgi:hypothetical protein
VRFSAVYEEGVNEELGPAVTDYWILCSQYLDTHFGRIEATDGLYHVQVS